jgi:hypothetical protein
MAAEVVARTMAARAQGSAQPGMPLAVLAPVRNDVAVGVYGHVTADLKRSSSTAQRGQAAVKRQGRAGSACSMATFTAV